MDIKRKVRNRNTKNHYRERIKGLIILILSLLVIYLIYRFRHLLRGWRRWGYLGLFLVNLISSSTVFFPVPGVATVFLGGVIWNPLLVGIISGIGAGLGELSGYFLGFGGRGLASFKKREENHWSTRLERFFHKSGFITIFLFALLPLPFDVVGMTAGVLNYPVWKFLLATILGRGIRNSVIAWTGAKVLPL